MGFVGEIVEVCGDEVCGCSVRLVQGFGMVWSLWGDCGGWCGGGETVGVWTARQGWVPYPPPCMVCSLLQQQHQWSLGHSCALLEETPSGTVPPQVSSCTCRWPLPTHVPSCRTQSLPAVRLLALHANLCALRPGRVLSPCALCTIRMGWFHAGRSHLLLSVPEALLDSRS